jgi:hypothetical protein
MLAPWQMAPGRGFMSAAQVGYKMRFQCRTWKSGTGADFLIAP